MCIGVTILSRVKIFNPFMPVGLHEMCLSDPDTSEKILTHRLQYFRMRGVFCVSTSNELGGMLPLENDY